MTVIVASIFLPYTVYSGSDESSTTNTTATNSTTDAHRKEELRYQDHVDREVLAGDFEGDETSILKQLDRVHTMLHSPSVNANAVSRSAPSSTLANSVNGSHASSTPTTAPMAVPATAPERGNASSSAEGLGSPIPDLMRSLTSLSASARSPEPAPDKQFAEGFFSQEINTPKQSSLSAARAGGSALDKVRAVSGGTATVPVSRPSSPAPRKELLEKTKPIERQFPSLSVTNAQRPKAGGAERLRKPPSALSKVNTPAVSVDVSPELVPFESVYPDSSPNNTINTRDSLATRLKRTQTLRREPISELDIESPWKVVRQTSGNGGLRNAVLRATQEGILTDVQWVGTLGIATDSISPQQIPQIEEELAKRDCYPTIVSDSTFEGHYTHFCKQILWPTLHYQIPDNPKNKAYEDHSFDHYRALNQACADRIVSIYKEGDVIWVNDYHLLLVPEMVREKLPTAEIGFFLHVSFPSSEVFRCLASRKQLLEGMLGANCIGFQIPEYTRHFLQTCNRILAVDTLTTGIRDGDKFVSVISTPIGIDPTSLQEWSRTAQVGEWRQLIRQQWGPKKIIFSRDKVDILRGLKQKLDAYEQFLRANPDWISKVIFIQVCLSGGGDKELDSEIAGIVDRINSLSDNVMGSPSIIMLHQDIGFSQYMALLSEAHVFAVTSLREGMNLTCHEYVYCNETRPSGVLMLSEFTGAASLLGKYSVLVNPWDKKGLANGFLRALTMDQAESKTKLDHLKALVRKHSCTHIVDDLLKGIHKAWKEEQLKTINANHRLDLHLLKSQYDSLPLDTDKKRIFFLNLDPTHMEMAQSNTATNATTGKASKSIVSKMIVSPQRKINALYNLAADPRNIIYVLSVEERTSMEIMYRRVPNIGLVAENGAFLRPAGAGNDKEWIKFWQVSEWRNLVINTLDSGIVKRIPGSSIHMHETNIVCNLGEAMEGDDAERNTLIIGELVNHINDAFGAQGVRCRYADNQLYVDSRSASKLSAVKKALELVKSPLHFMLYCADSYESQEDDRVFDFFNSAKDIDYVHTVGLGVGGTLAKWTLEGVNGMLSAINALDK